MNIDINKIAELEKEHEEETDSKLQSKDSLIDDQPKRWYIPVPFTGKRLIFEGFFHYVGWYRPKLNGVV